MSISTRAGGVQGGDLGAAGHRQRPLRPAEAALAVGHHRQQAWSPEIRRAARSSASASA